MGRRFWHILTIPCMAFLLGLAAVTGLWLAASPARAQGTIYVDDDNCPDPGTGTALDTYCQIQAQAPN